MTDKQIDQLTAKLFIRLTDANLIKLDWRTDDKADKAIREAISDFEAMQTQEYVEKWEALRIDQEDWRSRVQTANKMLKRSKFRVHYDTQTERTYVDLK